MLELLIVFGLASIGVFFTSTSNDPETAKNNRHTHDGYGFDEEEEQGGGIGILGIDVARKVRSRRRKKSEPMKVPEPLHESAGRAPKTAAMLAASGPGAPLVSGDSLGEEVDDECLGSVRSVLAGDADLHDVDTLDGTAPARDGLSENWDHEEDGSDADDGLLDDHMAGQGMADAEEDALRTRAMLRARAATQDDDFDEDFDDGDDLDDEAFVTREDGLSGYEAEAEAERMEAALDDWDDDDDLADLGAPMTTNEMDGPPVIDDFDPAEDQIVIGYRPGEAGDGRIGISEDPESPGTARVTLGGRVVAVVHGGYGKVHARHIELVMVDEAA